VATADVERRSGLPQPVAEPGDGHVRPMLDYEQAHF